MADNEEITQDYLDFVKVKKVRNLTRNQWRFVEFLLRNKRETARMGSYEQLFRQVRTYLKNDYDWGKEPVEDKLKTKKIMSSLDRVEYQESLRTNVLRKMDDLRNKIETRERCPEGEQDLELLSNIDDSLDEILSNWYY